jgi:hypothetical protein
LTFRNPPHVVGKREQQAPAYRPAFGDHSRSAIFLKRFLACEETARDHDESKR